MISPMSSPEVKRIARKVNRPTGSLPVQRRRPQRNSTQRVRPSSARDAAQRTRFIGASLLLLWVGTAYPLPRPGDTAEVGPRGHTCGRRPVLRLRQAGDGTLLLSGCLEIRRKARSRGFNPTFVVEARGSAATRLLALRAIPACRGSRCMQIVCASLRCWTR